MVDKQGQPFNAYVRMDKDQNRPRFYKWNPDKKQETSKEKVVAVAEEHKTQVAVNNHGKTNEATKNVNEPLKSGQTQPTAAQKQKQDEKNNSVADVRCKKQETRKSESLYVAAAGLITICIRNISSLCTKVFICHNPKSQYNII